MPAWKIERVESLDPAQKTALFKWGPDVFSSGQLALKWDSNADWRFLAYREGALVGHVALLLRTIRCGGRDVPVCGLGGLITLPHARGQGVARRLMDAFHEFSVQQTGAESIVLFCLDRLVPFYERRGYQEVLAPVVIQQPSEPVRCPLHTFHRQLRNAPWPDGAVDVAGLPW